MAPAPSEVILGWDVRHLTPRMRDVLLQHGAGAMPFIARGNDQHPIIALVKRRMLRFIEQGKKTEPTVYGDRAITRLVGELMKLEGNAAPSVVPATAEPERETA